MNSSLLRAAILTLAAVSLSACYSRVEERAVPAQAPAAQQPIVIAPQSPPPSSGTVIVRP